MTEKEPNKPANDADADTDAIEFKGGDPEEASKLLPPESGGAEPFHTFEPQAVDPAPIPPIPPGSTAGWAEAPEPRERAGEPLEWRDEAERADEGHFFSEPSPEPPLQPYEILQGINVPSGKGKRRKPDAESSRGGFELEEDAPRDTGGAGEKSGSPWKRMAEAGAAGAAMAAGRNDDTQGCEAANAEHKPSLLARVVWGLMPVLLFVAGYGSVVMTYEGIGYSWDEAFYYDPALDAGDWLLQVARGEMPFDADTIDRHWGKIHEHPSVQKFVAALGIMMFKDPARHLVGMRLPMAILFGIALTLIYLIGRRAFGPVPSFFSVVLFMTMPRIFGHAHFGSIEIPLLMMTVLVVWTYLKGLDSPWWAVATGVCFGLLLATKINGFFLPVALVLWSHMYARAKYVNNLFCMLTIGPVVFVAAWPWLWHDTLPRMLEYLYFHLSHQQTAVWFEGRKWGYGDVNAPWYYPLTMIAVTTPALSLAFIGLGVLRNLWAPQRRPYGVLFLLVAATMIGVVMRPGSPRYDGVRLILPAFPFLALLGGSGMVWVLRRFDRYFRRKRERDAGELRRLLHRVQWALVLLALANGTWAIVNYHPYLLSYYNALVGGVAGAEAKGYEVTYWGEAVNADVIRFLNDLPEKADGTPVKIWPRALQALCLLHMQRWGVLDDDLLITDDVPVDYHLVLNRKGMWTLSERGGQWVGPDWALAENAARFRERSWPAGGLDGVPLVTLYKTGVEFEMFWPDYGVRGAAGE